MTKHTPTPWEAQPFLGEEEDGVGIIGLRTDSNGVPYPSPTNGLVAWATLHPTEIDANDGTRAIANAAFIVKAVNAHDALVAALQTILNANNEFRDGMPKAWRDGHQWEGDPLQDACDAAEKLLADVGQAQVSGGE